MPDPTEIERFIQPLLDCLGDRWVVRYANVPPIGPGVLLTTTGVRGHIAITPCRISNNVVIMGVGGDGKPHFQLYSYAADDDDDERIDEIVRTGDLNHLLRLLEAWRATRAIATPPVPQAPFAPEERAHLAAIARGRADPLDVVLAFDPQAVMLTDRGRHLCSRTLADIDHAQLARNFPRQDDGRLPLDTDVLLVELDTTAPPKPGRSTWLCASSPARRADVAHRLTLRLANGFTANASHRWDLAPWLFRRDPQPPRFDQDLLRALAADAPPASATEDPALRAAVAALCALDAGRFADAFAQYGIELSEHLNKVLASVPLNLRHAHHAPAWAVATRRILWESAPWQFPDLIQLERQRLDAWRAQGTKRRPEKPAELRLQLLPHQRHQRKAALTLTHQPPNPPALTLTWSATNARTPESQWKRPISLDLARLVN